MSYLLYHGICDHHFVHKLTQLAPDSLKRDKQEIKLRKQSGT